MKCQCIVFWYFAVCVVQSDHWCSRIIGTSSLQYDNIDGEHKGLFKGIFDCAAAPADSAKLASLLQLVKDHFTDEEGMMKKTNFDGLPTHNKIHTEFVDKLTSLSCPLDDATIAFAKKWSVSICSSHFVL